MYPLDTFWVNCLKNLNVTSMYPLGKCPFAPSVISLLSKATSEKLYLIFSFEDPGHQSRPHGSCEPHSRFSLVQLGVSLIPVKDPHHQKTTEDRIVDPLPILEPELFQTTNHIRP